MQHSSLHMKHALNNEKRKKEKRNTHRTSRSNISCTIENVKPTTDTRYPVPNGEEDEKQNQWGHDLPAKPTNTIHILLQNVGGIDLTAEGSVKLAALHAFMQETQVNIAALTECNVAWHLVDKAFYPLEQTKFWWENSHWSITHNRQEQHPTKHQRGGTCILVANQLSYWAQHLGDDKMGLSRWCWARLRGKNNRYLCIVSIYRPCPSNGPLSTYQQQVHFWSRKNLDCCPRLKLLEDLKEEIHNWQEAGEQVILLADMNEEVMAPSLHKFCQDLNLVEAISMLHGRYPLPTHQSGSKAIDRIYLSRTLL